MPRRASAHAGAGAGAGAGNDGAMGAELEYENDDGLTEFDRRVLAIIEQYPNGCPNSVLQSKISDTAQLVAVLNKLVKQKRRVELLQGQTGTLFRAVDAALARKLEGLGRDDLHVLQHIERAHDMAIWVKDLKRLTGLSQQALNKCLKRMSNRCLIKKVNSKTHKQRRLFMMYDLQPNRELTGGAMYTTDSMELDHDFIQSLRKFVTKVLAKAGPCSRTVLSRRLEASRISTVSLSTEEMQQVLDTLEYDGKIKRVDARLAGFEDEDESERNVSYAIAKRITVPDALSAMPCGVCPVFEDCTPGGVISPATCVYIDKWLDF